MPSAIPDPSYLPPSLEFVVGILPSPAMTDLGGGLMEIKYPRANLQNTFWNDLAINKHVIVNDTKCQAAPIVAKSQDAIFRTFRVQLDAGDVWTNGDLLCPQFRKFILHLSNRKMADAFARETDTLLGWRADGQWGYLKQRDAFDPDDGAALHVNPGDDLAQTAEFDVQLLTATGQVINICRSDEPNNPMGGLSDGKPPLEVRRKQVMTLQAALDMREDARAQRKG